MTCSKLWRFETILEGRFVEVLKRSTTFDLYLSHVRLLRVEGWLPPSYERKQKAIFM